jgi:hypothetical protein
MQKQRLNAYLNLIQELLTCPQGEEWIRLKHHEQLVDAQLLQVMAQVATQLARQGDREAAIFLHHWAAKLRHILLKEGQPTASEEDKTEAYLGLIEQLLTSPEGMEESILQAHQALIGPGLVHKMQEVARQFILQGDVKTAQFLEGLAHQLNQRWLQAHDFQAANLQKTAAQPSPQPSAVASHQPRRRRAAWERDAPQERSAPAAATAVKPKAETPPPKAETPPLKAETPAPNAKPDLSDPWDAPPDPVTPPKTPAMATATPPMQPDDTPAIAAGLNAIAAALQQLTQTLAASQWSQPEPQTPALHPLWYLERLEQACSSGWHLTTEEVEQLIGVKPHCPKAEIVYQRGNWCFTKVGKLGGQTAWQVSKLP